MFGTPPTSRTSASSKRTSAASSRRPSSLGPIRRRTRRASINSSTGIARRASGRWARRKRARWPRNERWRPTIELRRFLRLRRRIIEDRPEPALDLADFHALAPRVIFDLVALDLGDAEIMRVGMGDIEAGDRRAWPHRVALGQLHADFSLRVDEAEQRRLLGMVGLGGIAGRRADAAIGLVDQLVRRESLVRRIGPEFAAHALMHGFGEGF